MTAMTANEITISCKFENGQQFASFQELRDRIAEFERQSYVQLYIRRSRTIEAAMKRAPKKSFLQELKYSEVDYACIHGGKKFASRSKGKRTNHA